MTQASALRYQVQEGWEQLPAGYVHRDVAGVAVDGEDRVFLICRGDHPIIVYDQKGNFQRSWGEGEFTYRTHGITTAPDGTVWATDDGNHTVRQFTPTGKLLLTLGTLNTPSDTGSDAGGRAHVSEPCGHKGQTSQRRGPISTPRPGRVSVFDRDGRLLARWGGPDATAAGSFAAPHGLAVDSRGDVYVSEVTWTFAVSRGLAPAGCHTFQKFALKT